MKKINILIICLLFIFVTGCKKEKDNNINNYEQGQNTTITLEEYNKIKTGMSYSEIKEIIGGDCNKQTDQNKENEEVYICSGKMAGTNATITFENDKVKTKTQTGLE